VVLSPEEERIYLIKYFSGSFNSTYQIKQQSNSLCLFEEGMAIWRKPLKQIYQPEYNYIMEKCYSSIVAFPLLWLQTVRCNTLGYFKSRVMASGIQKKKNAYWYPKHSFCLFLVCFNESCINWLKLIMFRKNTGFKGYKNNEPPGKYTRRKEAGIASHRWLPS